MTETDHELARTLAVDAGALLLSIRDGDRTQADKQADEFLLKRLAELRPDDGILSEESADNPDRLTHERVWIIDPLDGTREYGEPPRTDWAVHVALAINHQPAIGAVALPGADTVHHTGNPPTIAAPTTGPIRIAVSRTRPTPLAQALKEHLDAELVPMGSAGAKAMAVITGHIDVYAHSGGQYEWDSCAPAAVAHAAGLHTSRLDGSPLEYNQPNPYLPDLLICRPELADTILKAIRDVSG